MNTQQKPGTMVGRGMGCKARKHCGFLPSSACKCHLIFSRDGDNSVCASIIMGETGDARLKAGDELEGGCII